LGASIGGELMNPGGTQYGAIVKGIHDASGQNVSYVECVAATRDLNLASLGVATLVLCGLIYWEERREGFVDPRSQLPGDPPLEPLKVNYIKALVPIVPLVLLFLVSPPAPLFPLPHDWLVTSKEDASLFSSRLVGAAMLVGLAVAMITSLVFREGENVLGRGTKAFFEGMGYGFREIISIIAVAACFAEGVMLVGVGELIQNVVALLPALLIPAAGYLTLGFAFLCGSGIAATKGLFAVFAQSAVEHGADPLDVGAIMAVCADAGRTMSPVAAVTLMCARLTGTRPADLIKRVAAPIVAGATVAIAMAALNQ
jgi:DcuC family C4-dicarboxylate transporter